MDCKSRFKITRTEWVYSLYNRGIDTFAKLKERLVQRQMRPFDRWGKTEIQSREEVKKFFTFCFRYQVDSDLSRQLNIMTASNTLETLMGRRNCYFLESFLTYVREAHQYMNLDQFKIFYDFQQCIRHDFSNYNVADSWPTMFDDYYLWMMKKSNMMVDESS